MFAEFGRDRPKLLGALRDSAEFDVTPRAFLGPLAALAVVAAPIVALVLLRASDDEPGAVRSNPVAVVSQAQARTILDEKRVTITPAWADGRALRSAEGGGAGGGGVVTAVFRAPGSVVEHGAALYSVDGVMRVAVASAQPFSRALKAGDTGADVSALHDVLVSLGYLGASPAAATTYGTAAQNAVQTLERNLGVRDPDGDFDPSLFVWLPESPFRLGTFAVDIAAPPPAAGQVLGEEPPRLVGATIASANPQEALSFPAGVEAVLVVGTVRIPVDPASLSLSPEGLALLEPLLKPKAERADGVLQRAAPLNVAAVPSTAIQVGASGALCAWLPEGESYRAVAVKVAGARAGVTNVTEGLAAGQEVLANPAEVLESPQCPG